MSSENNEGWNLDDETLEAVDNIGDMLRPIAKEILTEEEWKSIPDDSPVKSGGDEQ